MNSSSRANTGCTAPDCANTPDGNDFKMVTATADLALLDKNLRREKFIQISPAKAQRTQRLESNDSSFRLCAFAPLRLCVFASLRETPIYLIPNSSPTPKIALPFAGS